MELHATNSNNNNNTPTSEIKKPERNKSLLCRYQCSKYEFYRRSFSYDCISLLEFAVILSYSSKLSKIRTTDLEVGRARARRK